MLAGTGLREPRRRWRFFRDVLVMQYPWPTWLNDQRQEPDGIGSIANYVKFPGDGQNGRVWFANPSTEIGRRLLGGPGIGHWEGHGPMRLNGFQEVR